jgi:hypothetical protein
MVLLKPNRVLVVVEAKNMSLIDTLSFFFFRGGGGGGGGVTEGYTYQNSEILSIVFASELSHAVYGTGRSVKLQHSMIST